MKNPGVSFERFRECKLLYSAETDKLSNSLLRLMVKSFTKESEKIGK